GASMGPGRRQKLLAILFSVLPLFLISCAATWASEIRNEHPIVRVRDSLVYAGMVDRLKKVSRDESARKTEITLESPLTAKVAVSLDERGVLLVDGIIKNKNSFSWYYPGHIYYLNASFMLFDSEMKVVSRMPNYGGF